MKLSALTVAIVLSSTIATHPTRAQETASPPARGLPETLNVFLDCSFFCDFDYIRTEIPFVNWVRDRTDADVHRSEEHTSDLPSRLPLVCRLPLATPQYHTR